jgi:hypothetical protein
MPPKPRFASEKQRMVVIAALLLTLLAGSLVGAYAFTRTRSALPERLSAPPVERRIGNLTLLVPGDFNLQKSVRAEDGLDQVLVLGSTGHRQELVLAALAPLDGRKTADRARQAASKLLNADELAGLEREIESPVKIGLLTAWFWSGAMVDSRDPQYEVLALVTLDNRHFWAVYQTTAIDEQGTAERQMSAARKRLEQMLASARVTAPPATAPESN